MKVLDAIRSDREQARARDDPNAGLCFLALADTNGNASVRTLVLREVAENRFRVFVNETSPKWRLFVEGAGCELLLWYPSVQRQYRISGELRALDAEIVRAHWHRRPAGSKYLDQVYAELAQSTAITSRAVLTDEIARLQREHPEEELQPPESAAGLELIANRIEALDLSYEDRIHARQLHRFDGEAWTSEVLVP